MKLLKVEKRYSGSAIMPVNGHLRHYYRHIGTFQCPACKQLSP